MAAAVFGAAPRALAGVISLQQTVDLVRLSIEVVEEQRRRRSLGPSDAADGARGRSLRYAREVAFATAEVYARAAEMRGAWDARLEALVVDAVLRAEADEAVLSRASALGWAAAATWPWCSARRPPRAHRDRRSSTTYAGPRAPPGMDALCAVQGDRLVVVLGGVDGRRRRGRAVVADHFGDGPGRGRPGRRRPRPGAPSRPAAALVGATAPRPGWPEAPATGAQRRPAARARARRRRPRPPAAGRRDLPPAAATPAAP